MRKTATAVVLAFMAMLSVGAAQANACAGADRPPNGQTTDAARQAVTCLINHRRRHFHLRRVRSSVPLAAAAQSHSNAMAASNFFSHEGDGTPTSRVSAAGYMHGAATWGVGEALEWGTGRGGSPRAIVAGWMASPEHRAILLTDGTGRSGSGWFKAHPWDPTTRDRPCTRRTSATARARKGLSRAYFG